MNHVPKPAPAIRRRLARLDAAADQFDCSVRTIRRMIAAGAITGYRLGPRMLRVDLDEIEAVVRRVPATAVRAGGRS